MIWRNSYSTKAFESLSAWPEEGRLLDGTTLRPEGLRLILAGWSQASLLEQRKWAKLFEGSFGLKGLTLGLISSTPDLAPLRAAALCLPPSSEGSLVLWVDPAYKLQNSLSPDLESRAVAFHPPSGLLMVGPATEEAWEAMQKAIEEG